MAITYRVKVSRPDLQLEVDGDKKFVLDILARFDKTTQTPTPAPATQKTGKGSKATTLLPTGTKGISPGEFIRQFQFKKHTDLVMAFGYYLEKHSGLSAFSAADINNCYYEAKMESSNTSQMVIQNIKRGYMMQAKSKPGEQKGSYKLFTLTRSGEQHIEKAPAGGNDE